MTFALRILFSIIILSSFAAADGATVKPDVGASELAFCRSLLETEIVIVRRVRAQDRTMASGERVRIDQGGSLGLDGFYLGRVNGRLYFAPDRIANPDRPVFFLPVERVGVDTGEIPAVDIRLDYSGQNYLCSPQTVMLCLDHLREPNALSDVASERIKYSRGELFARLTRSFAQGYVEDRPEFRALEEKARKATTARELKEHLEDFRRRALALIATELRDLKVEATYTTSYRKLKRHLARGGPAYLSVAGAPISVFRPPLNEWRDNLTFFHPDVTTGTVPRPFLLALPYAPHAVYAVTVLPPVRGWGGRLLGSRVVVFDPADGGFNVWPTTALRFWRSAHFLLIGTR